MPASVSTSASYNRPLLELSTAMRLVAIALVFGALPCQAFRPWTRPAWEGRRNRQTGHLCRALAGVPRRDGPQMADRRRLGEAPTRRRLRHRLLVAQGGPPDGAARRGGARPPEVNRPAYPGRTGFSSGARLVGYHDDGRDAVRRRARLRPKILPVVARAMAFTPSSPTSSRS